MRETSQHEDIESSGVTQCGDTSSPVHEVDLVGALAQDAVDILIVGILFHPQIDGKRREGVVVDDSHGTGPEVVAPPGRFQLLKREQDINLSLLNQGRIHLAGDTYMTDNTAVPLCHA